MTRHDFIELRSLLQRARYEREQSLARCAGKHAYVSYAEARGPNKYRLRARVPYRCQDCGQWHVKVLG